MFAAVATDSIPLRKQTESNPDWKSSVLTHQLHLIASKKTQKAQSQQPFRISVRRCAYFLFQASFQSHTDPHIVPETFTLRFCPRCQNDHICFSSSINFRPIYGSALIVYDFNPVMCQFAHFAPSVLKKKGHRVLRCRGNDAAWWSHTSTPVTATGCQQFSVPMSRTRAYSKTLLIRLIPPSPVTSTHPLQCICSINGVRFYITAKIFPWKSPDSWKSTGKKDKPSTVQLNLNTFLHPNHCIQEFSCAWQRWQWQL